MKGLISMNGRSTGMGEPPDWAGYWEMGGPPGWVGYREMGRPLE